MTKQGNLIIFLTVVAVANACQNGLTKTQIYTIAPSGYILYYFNNNSEYFDTQSQDSSPYGIDFADARSVDIQTPSNGMSSQCFTIPFPTTGGFVKPYHLYIFCRNLTVPCHIALSHTDCIPACTNANLCASDGCGGFCPCESTSISQSPTRKLKKKPLYQNNSKNGTNANVFIGIVIAALVAVVLLVSFWQRDDIKKRWHRYWHSPQNNASHTSSNSSADDEIELGG